MEVGDGTITPPYAQDVNHAETLNYCVVLHIVYINTHLFSSMSIINALLLRGHKSPYYTGLTLTFYYLIANT